MSSKRNRSVQAAASGGTPSAIASPGSDDPPGAGSIAGPRRRAAVPGRRRPTGAAEMQPAVTDALGTALFEEWAERGYGALSLEAVARRARVGKAALYRRWPSKLAMVVERLESFGIERVRTPDTGAFESDVRIMVGDVARLMRHRVVRRILPDLHAEMQRSPVLAKAIRGRLTTERRHHGETIVLRAIERGELRADTDVELVTEAIAALVHWRVVATGRAVRKRDIDAITSFVVSGAGTARPPDGPPG